MRNKVGIFLVLLLTIFLCSCNSEEKYSTELTEWLNQYNCSFDTVPNVEADSDAFSFVCVTNDSRKIEFLVTCRKGYIEVPFAFRIPVPEIKTDDNFAEAVSNYLSASLEPVDADSYYINDIADMILNEMSKAEDLFDEYGIKGEIPSLRFAIIKNGKEHTFICANNSKSIIKDALMKEMFE